MRQLDQRSLDFIVEKEVGSREQYERKYTRPEWPGGSSGITIGVGYDLGYKTEAEVRQDWSGLVSDEMVEDMIDYVGVKGRRARSMLHQARRSSIDVPWDAAYAVFRDKKMPKWVAAVQRNLPNTDMLPDLSMGMLTSLTFNRGAAGYRSMKPRFREMRAIKRLMSEQRFNEIPAQILSMRRLWPNLSGLRRRRAEEANLFAEGLRS